MDNESKRARCGFELPLVNLLAYVEFSVLTLILGILGQRYSWPSYTLFALLVALLAKGIVDSWRNLSLIRLCKESISSITSKNYYSLFKVTTITVAIWKSSLKKYYLSAQMLLSFFIIVIFAAFGFRIEMTIVLILFFMSECILMYVKWISYLNLVELWTLTRNECSLINKDYVGIDFNEAIEKIFGLDAD